MGVWRQSFPHVNLISLKLNQYHLRNFSYLNYKKVKISKYEFPSFTSAFCDFICHHCRSIIVYMYKHKNKEITQHNNARLLMTSINLDIDE